MYILQRKIFKTVKIKVSANACTIEVVWATSITYCRNVDHPGNTSG